MITAQDRLLAALPALLALLLLLLFAMPVESVLPLAPNVAWLMTVLVGMLCPLAWPREVAFFAGLLQDVVMGTPLGSQALVALILWMAVAANRQRHMHQLFRVQWLEATGALVAAHLLLWMLLQATGATPPETSRMLLAGVVTGLWYPVFFVPLRWMVASLPGAMKW